MLLKPSNNELADFFNVPGKQIEAWKQQGMPTETFYVAAKWYFAKKAGRKKVDPIVKLKEKILTITVEQKTGMVIKKERAVAITEQILAIVKEELLGYAGSLSPQIANQNVASCQSIIDRFIKSRLNSLVSRIDPLVGTLEEGEKDKDKYLRIGV